MQAITYGFHHFRNRPTFQEALVLWFITGNGLFPVMVDYGVKKKTQSIG